MIVFQNHGRVGNIYIKFKECIFISYTCRYKSYKKSWHKTWNEVYYYSNKEIKIICVP